MKVVKKRRNGKMPIMCGHDDEYEIDDGFTEIDFE